MKKTCCLDGIHEVRLRFRVSGLVLGFRVYLGFRVCCFMNPGKHQSIRAASLASGYIPYMGIFSEQGLFWRHPHERSCDSPQDQSPSRAVYKVTVPQRTHKSPVLLRRVAVPCLRPGGAPPLGPPDNQTITRFIPAIGRYFQDLA